MSECWNGWCIASDCDGYSHVDTTGYTWLEAQGDVYDPERGEYVDPTELGH